ncbi:HupE / UreJ protein [Tropicimonas sediminicola]|uniref:HupE / UreJ protein n=2 Tax=Tropicimonas sediminicola TaxID=1031541 RepID=A0A239CCB9_9RHOB|nr:HupE / UreJ protein [Tropicimonas sediminicola]
MTRNLLLICALSMGLLHPAQAHEVRPAVADVEVGADRVNIVIRLTLEPLVAGMSLAGLEDTNDSPLSGYHDRLREMPPEALDAAFREAWPALSESFLLSAGETPLTPGLISVRIPEIGDTALPRDSTLEIEAALPDDGTPVTVGWAAGNGPLVIRQVGGGETAYSAILQGGDVSAPLPREDLVNEGVWPVFSRYVVSGFEHIVPKGLDHILFVLGLFFFSLHLRPLLFQVSAFTLAHTTTLALASLGIVSVPASVVEPLIAASIVYIALENIVGGRIGWARIAVVFGFGLLHGLGFASVLGDVGMEAGRFVTGLIGFNVGVEFGQLAVILVAFLLVGLPFGQQSWYRGVIAIPASAAIALVGAWWTLQRVLGL